MLTATQADVVRLLQAAAHPLFEQTPSRDALPLWRWSSSAASRLGLGRMPQPSELAKRAGVHICQEARRLSPLELLVEARTRCPGPNSTTRAAPWRFDILAPAARTAFELAISSARTELFKDAIKALADHRVDYLVVLAVRFGLPGGFPAGLCPESPAPSVSALVDTCGPLGLSVHLVPLVP